MDHDRSCVSSGQFRVVGRRLHRRVLIGGLVSKFEPEREVKVQLDGTTLVLPSQSIEEGDVNLGAVKGAIAGVQSPLRPKLLREGIQGSRELCLRHVPLCNIANILLGPRRELQFVREAKQGIDTVEEFECPFNLLLDLSQVLARRQSCRQTSTNLIDSAKDVGIILLETSHSSKPRQGTRKLIAVEHTKVSHAQRQFLVGDVRVAKDLAVARTVHRL